jgi:hypothetical protein
VTSTKLAVAAQEHVLEQHLDEAVSLATTIAAEAQALGYGVYADYFANVALQVGSSLNGARAEVYGKTN